MYKWLLSLALVGGTGGAVNAQQVYVFPDGRVQWTPNVNARAVGIEDLPADLQDALLAQRATFPTVRGRIAQYSADRPRPVQYVNGVPTRSGLIPSRMRQPVYRPSYSGSSGPQVNFGVGLNFGLGPFTFGLQFGR